MARSIPDDIKDERDPLVPEIVEVTPEEGRRIFDEAAREWVGMSGEDSSAAGRRENSRPSRTILHIGAMLISS